MSHFFILTHIFVTFFTFLTFYYYFIIFISMVCRMVNGFLKVCLRYKGWEAVF